MPSPLSWDIVCRIVDNFGDIGICWRLARQIAHERGEQVRLWIDDMTAAASLLSAINPLACRQTLDGVDIMPLSDLAPADFYTVVIEAFGCGLPVNWLQAMSAAAPQPVWINLEYLSAEAWVDGCHGLSSRQPRQPLTQYFFFPGFTARTGGLLREADALAARDIESSHATLKALGWRSDFGMPISLFCYRTPALPCLLEHWRNTTPLCVLVAAGLPAEQVAAWLGQDFAPGTVVQRGQLHLLALPWLTQADFDQLLAACACNLVRGEDSIVRAIWAAKPWLWHIYPTEDLAHLTKLEAMLQRIEAACPSADTAALRALSLAWNRADLDTLPACWDAYSSTLPQQTDIALAWRGELAQHDDLLAQLARFVTGKL